MKKIFYLTFDGILDPLGKSQILSYLKRCNIKHDIKVFSLEKEKNIKRNKKEIDKIKNFFDWRFEVFNESKYFIFKLFFYIKLLFVINKIIKKKNYDIMHCRGLLPGLYGYLFKNFYKQKIIFDMRSFWVDERIESQNTKEKNFLLFSIQNILKYFETKLIKKSDWIIVLTFQMKNYIKDNYNKNSNITVIPCSSDFSKIYSLSNKKISKNQIKKICYVGSVGKMYLIKEILIFFKYINFENNFQLKLIVNQPDKAKRIYKKVYKNKISKNIKILSLPHEKISSNISDCHLLLSFIRNGFSKIASSPTKISEALSMGIPIICNKGVGDDQMLKKKNLLIFVDLEFKKNKVYYINEINKLLANSKLYFAVRAKKIYDINLNSKKYINVYDKV